MRTQESHLVFLITASTGLFDPVADSSCAGYNGKGQEPASDFDRCIGHVNERGQPEYRGG